MILTCPVCSARYLIAGDAIGEQGRDVRCGKCGNSWTQEPVHDSLDELSRANPSPQDIPASADLDAAVESFLNDEIPEAVKPLPPEPPVQQAAQRKSAEMKPAFVSKIKLPNPKILGAAIALVIFLVLLSIILLARGPLISLLPFTKPIFVAIGLEEEGDPRTLVFDSITAKIEGDNLMIAGSLINLSAQTHTLHPMTVDILGADGSKLQSLPAPVEEKTLKGEDSLKLDFVFKDIPKEAQQARIRFSDDKEEPAAVEEQPTTDAKDADNTHVQPEAETSH